VDLVLLDIQIQGEWDGITTARQLTTFRALPFIFVTAFTDQQTVERANKTAPSAYLVKPYQSRSLLIAIELALQNFACRKTMPYPEGVPLPGAQDVGTSSGQKDTILSFNDNIFIKQQLKFHKIHLPDIRFMEAEGNYIYIHTPDRKYVLRHALSRVLEKLHYPGLVRVHRSFAVNMHHLESFSDHSIFLEGREIPIGRHYKEVFFRQFDCR
jgi:DNA-binding LytR/AlgR family response regulator